MRAAGKELAVTISTFRRKKLGKEFHCASRPPTWDVHGLCSPLRMDGGSPPLGADDGMAHEAHGSLRPAGRNALEIPRLPFRSGRRNRIVCGVLGEWNMRGGPCSEARKHPGMASALSPRAGPPQLVP